jgi:hypothetical protein
VAREFAEEGAENVAKDLIAVLKGWRAGNWFERSALRRLFPYCPRCGNMANLESVRGKHSCELCELVWSDAQHDRLDVVKGGA